MKPEILALLAWRLRTCVVGVLCMSLLAGCSVTGSPRSSPDPAQGMQLKDLAKTDIDTVTDVAMALLEAEMRKLTEKLYARNPVQLTRQVGDKTVAQRMQQLFKAPGELIYAEVQGKTSVAAMALALDPKFKGDRVFALMVGLVDMIHRSYNYNSEFFMLDELDEQKLYNSARNIEILVWQLKHHQDADGKPLLLTNAPGNLSYERLFGKMIATQDLMAQVTADKMGRSITRVVRGVASMVFLPI